MRGCIPATACADSLGSSRQALQLSAVGAGAANLPVLSLPRAQLLRWSEAWCHLAGGHVLLRSGAVDHLHPGGSHQGPPADSQGEPPPARPASHPLQLLGNTHMLTWTITATRAQALACAAHAASEQRAPWQVYRRRREAQSPQRICFHDYLKKAPKNCCLPHSGTAVNCNQLLS